jgi:hypothetical protein
VDSPNLYQAFGLDPMNVTDPFGESDFPPWLGFFAADMLQKLPWNKAKKLGELVMEQINKDLRGLPEGVDEQRIRESVNRVLLPPKAVVQLIREEQTAHPRQGTETYCNIAVWHMAGGETRDPRWDRHVRGRQLPSFQVTEPALEVLGRRSEQGLSQKRANEMYKSLHDKPGPWVKISPREAQEIANSGGFAFGVQERKGENAHGHIAAVRPWFANPRPDDPLIGNVGRTNADLPASRAFGRPGVRGYSEVDYYTEGRTRSAIYLKKLLEEEEQKKFELTIWEGLATWIAGSGD